MGAQGSNDLDIDAQLLEVVGVVNGVEIAHQTALSHVTRTDGKFIELDICRATTMRSACGTCNVSGRMLSQNIPGMAASTLCGTGRV